MKVIIQICAYNEAQNLKDTLTDLPRTIPGIDQIEILVVNDGSSDNTAEIAEEFGVDHLLNLKVNQGLATAFRKGFRYALKQEADFIVNTDGDNQYSAACIIDLLSPLIKKEADIVIGERPIKTTAHFTPIKKGLQRFGSWIVSQLSNAHIPDAASGFRAFTREAAAQLNIHSDFTPTMEILIQAGQRGMSIKSVQIKTNPPTRKSRLMRNTIEYVLRQTLTIISVYVIYQPLRFFSRLSLIFLIPGVALLFRYLYYHFTEPVTGHVQSVVIGTMFISVALLFWLIGLISNQIRNNRRFLEEIMSHVLQIEDQIKKQDDSVSS